MHVFPWRKKREGVGGGTKRSEQNKKGNRKRPNSPSQLDMQDSVPADPGLPPLVGVAVDGVNVRHGGDGSDGGLFFGLAREEAGRARGKQDPDRQVSVLREGLDDVGDLDTGYRIICQFLIPCLPKT